MANVIKPKRSTTAAAIPTTSDLADKEMAINLADKVVYVRNGGSVVAVANFSTGSGSTTVGFEIDGGSATTSYAGVPAFDFGSAA